MPHTRLRTYRRTLWGSDGLSIFGTRVLKVGRLAAACLVLSVGPARSEYHIDAGDVIEIVVARVPDLQRRVVVKADGTISFPLLGTIPVAGSTPAQLQVKVQSILAAKVFQQRAADGRDIEVAIDPAEITATVVEYRPVYLNGDVSKPGEYGYRPFMTVRQAIAMSGGYDVLRMRMVQPLNELADLRSSYVSLWIELAKDQAHIWRIKSELGDPDNVDQNVLMNVPLPRSVILQIINVESEQLALNQADHDKQKAFLRHLIKRGEEQIAILLDQQQKEDQGVQADTADLQKAMESYGKGSLPSPRVMDARRALLLSSTRVLQTTSQLMQLRRQQDDLLRQLQRLDDQRKIELLRQLQETAARTNSLRARLQGVSEKLQYATARTQGIRGNEVKADIAIFRKVEKRRERISADEDFELQPGDVVEVAVQMGQAEGWTARELNSHWPAPTDATSPATTTSADRAAAATRGPSFGADLENGRQ